MLVVGIGDRTRGDDSVGPRVARLVAALRLPGVEVVEQCEPLDLVEMMAGHDSVVIIDAVAAQGEPGRIDVWPVDALPPGRAGPVIGSHGLGVREALDLARALGCLPLRVSVVGVQGESFDTGTAMSERVRARLGTAARVVTSVIADAHATSFAATQPE
jgi:hydrogenase maturation protease